MSHVYWRYFNKLYTDTLDMTYPRKTNTRHQKTLDITSAGHINAIDVSVFWKYSDTLDREILDATNLRQTNTRQDKP